MTAPTPKPDERRFSRCGCCDWICGNEALKPIEPSVLAANYDDNTPVPSGFCPQCSGTCWTIKTSDVTGFSINTSGEEMGSTVAMPRIHWFGPEQIDVLMRNKVQHADAIDLLELACFMIRAVQHWNRWPNSLSLLFYASGEPFEMPPIVVVNALEKELEIVDRVTMSPRLITGKYPGWPMILKEGRRGWDRPQFH